MEHSKSLLMNLSLTDMNVTREHFDYNNTICYYGIYRNKYIILSVILIICCLGLSLNGIVIWLLGFRIKRSPFTVLILNLAIADFALLIFMAVLHIYYCTVYILTEIPILVLCSLSHIMYTTGQFLLTAISIDRCVCVLFPIWHRYSRPKCLSSALCALLWVSSFFFVGILNILKYVEKYEIIPILYFVVIDVFCLPLITTSTVFLFIKMCLKSKQIKRGRLLVMILITLLCFFILTFPLNVYVFFANIIHTECFLEHLLLNKYVALGACLNSSINPVIYFLVGRKKRAESRESIKVIFQRVFREDEDPENTEQSGNTVSTPP